MQNEEQKQYLEKVMKDCENENLSAETKVNSRVKKAESKNTTTERK
jgi:polyhydroxyalkanoate synthesis regulator phasin